MKATEAIKILEQVTAQVPGTRQDHVMILDAIQSIKAALPKEDEATEEE